MSSRPETDLLDYDEDGEPIIARERITYVVCPTCEGHGKIVHRGLSVWTESDRYEDPESFENMLDGRYDVTCDECHGQRVVSEQEQQDFAERRQDHFTRLQESGIYPGSPDYF